MPVRPLKPNYRVTTGYVPLPDGKAAMFEGTLERDLIVLMQFEPGFMALEDQPLRIPYVMESGRNSQWTPDALVHFEGWTGRKPMLIEVKDSPTLKREFAEWRPKFKAAVKLCRKNGWLFRIYTEKRIRTSRLENVRALRSFLEPPASDIDCARWVRTVREHPRSTLGHIVSIAAPTTRLKAERLYALNHCLAVRRILVDMDRPVTDSSPVWLPEGRA